MEILCPNCQKKLTILEQYAGQMLKCPLCGGTFTAPALPPAPAVPAAATYGVQPASAPPQVVDKSTHPAITLPPGPLPSVPSEALPEEPVFTEHTGRLSLSISPRIVQYVPAVLLFLVFVLTFFPWVQIRPGDVPVDSQSAWQAALGIISVDKEIEPQSWFIGKQRERALPSPLAGKAERPGFGALAFFYLLLLILNVVIVAAAVAVPFVKQQLRPALQPYLRWRWAAATLVTLLSFAFLFLQNAVGFGLERRAHDAVNEVAKKNDEDWTKNQTKGDYEDMRASEIPTEVAIFRGMYQQAIVRTFWYRCAFWFHFWALVFVFATMMFELRGPRPNPRVDVLW
jgi:hypothetical protein